MNSLFPVICSTAVEASKDFYVSVLGFKPVFAIDWYVQLQSPTDPTVQIAFVRQDHDSVPEGYRHPPRGVLVTVELQDVDALYAHARDRGCHVVLDLRDEAWGQRHFMVTDPNGLLLDVVKIIAPTREFVEANGLAGEMYNPVSG